jgi:cysteine desulfurase/selenocysteine lyase
MIPETALAFDVQRVRADFPILARAVRGRPLVYLDNAATTQKPQAVLDALTRYYTGINANVHRGVHELSERATEAFEAARERVRRFFNAASTTEIVFTRNATESINLVAHSFVRPGLQDGDEVVVSAMEHHSNIVPWQLAGARLRVVPVDDRGELQLDELEHVIGPRTRLVSITHMSNALGTITPAADIVRTASPCSSTARRRRITCLLTFGRSIAISMRRPDTSCTGRQESASCTGRNRVWTRCRHFSAAET